MFKLVWLMYLFARSASLQTPDDNHSYKNSFQSQEYSHHCFHNVLLEKGPVYKMKPNRQKQNLTYTIIFFFLIIDSGPKAYRT